MAPLRVSTTKSEWLPDDPTAFVPTRLWKLPFITTWDDSRNQNRPTDSAEEAKIHARGSFRRTCEKSAAYPAAISSSGRHPRPSTIVCTSAPPHAEGDPCSSSVPTCRRSALPL